MQKNHQVNQSRRGFLQAAPAVAAASFVLTDASLFSSSAKAESAPGADFQVFNAQQIQDDLKAQAAAPGSVNLVQEKTFAMVLTTETTKSAKEFEWHEGRDHIVQILDGSTFYALGGTPKDAHSPKPGEWLAPTSAEAKLIILNKGDILVIPRGTPHKRTTEKSVTFLLISPQGS